MKKLLTIVILLTGFFITSDAQDSLNLQSLINKAKNASPQAGKSVLYHEISQKSIENLHSQWYPTLDINARASWQSDVTSMDIQIPNIDIPTPSQDQYKVTFDATQMIYEGGIIKGQKDLQSIDLQLKEASIETALYQLEFTVTSYYFSILLIQKSINILDSSIATIDERIASLKSALVNGVITESTLLKLKAERINLVQNKSKLTQAKTSAIHQLSILCGVVIPKDHVFKAPVVWLLNEMASDYAMFSTRPENKQFDLSASYANQSAEVIKDSRKPKVAAFTQTGYGNPGLNFLEDEFSPWFIAGVNVSWNLWDWNVTDRKAQQAQLQVLLIENDRQAFNQQNILMLIKERENIQTYQSLLQTDSVLIEMRKEIAEEAASQLENGVITASDYLTELLQYQKADMQMASHEINLMLAKIRYQLILGFSISN